MNRRTRCKTRAKASGDRVLQELWRIKDDLSAAYGHDVSRLFAEARRHQAEARKPSPVRARTLDQGRQQDEGLEE